MILVDLVLAALLALGMSAILNLAYDANDWIEMTYDGHKILKHKDTENYLTYMGSGSNNGLKNVKKQSLKDNFEEGIKQQIESSTQNMTYLYSNWEEVDSRLYLCIIDCRILDANTGTYGYATYYYYFSDIHVYHLVTTKFQADYSFTYDAREVMDTIKNNSQI